MKVEVSGEKELDQKIEYPVLMKSINSKTIVLFLNRTEGIGLVSPHKNQLYILEDEWVPADVKTNWTKFTGQITLKND